jgi:hypothetical protein
VAFVRTVIAYSTTARATRLRCRPLCVTTSVVCISLTLIRTRIRGAVRTLTMIVPLRITMLRSTLPRRTGWRMGVTRRAIGLDAARVALLVAVGSVGALVLVGEAGVAAAGTGMVVSVAVGDGLLTMTSTSTAGMAMAVPWPEGTVCR